MRLSGAATLGTDPELYALKEAGKRMADALNAKVVFGGLGTFGRWMTFRLDDGSSNGTLYDSVTDAIARVPSVAAYWFEQVRPSSYSADECALTLRYARAAYDAGWRPDVQYPTPIMPVRLEDAHKKIRQLDRHARRRR